jgi:NTP pyrophosphatase (non-canonical NTP hydrolase)
MTKHPPKFAIGSPEWPGLSKLAEEAGETLQVVGKLMGTGGETAHWDGSDLRERLIEEISDLFAACDFVVAANRLDREAIRERRAKKLALFFAWHESDPIEIEAAGAGEKS